MGTVICWHDLIVQVRNRTKCVRFIALVHQQLSRERASFLPQQVQCLCFQPYAHSPVDTRSKHPTYPSATCSSTALHMLDSVIVRQVIVLSVLQQYSTAYAG